MTEEQQASSSWWNYASSAWGSIQETAKDFTESIQTENEETIQQIKSKVDSIDTDEIQSQLSKATTSINTFINTTMQSTLSTENALPRLPDPLIPSGKKQIQPKPFEKEKATYLSDPSLLKHHKEKYAKFISKELGLTDAEICSKGRSLLEINEAIRAYYKQLIPREVNETTFWKRYFYWKYNNQLREILISRHTNRASPANVEAKHSTDEDEDEDDEVQLGDVSDVKEEVDASGRAEADVKPVATASQPEMMYPSDAGSGGKSSETSWTKVVDDSSSAKTSPNSDPQKEAKSDASSEQRQDSNVAKVEEKQANDGGAEDKSKMEEMDISNKAENVQSEKKHDVQKGGEADSDSATPSVSDDEDQGAEVQNEDAEEEEDDWGDWS